MALIMTSPPALEPVTLGEAKTWLKVTQAQDDSLIEELIAAARLNVERLTGKHLIEQNWSQYLDRWPESGVVELPLSPVIAVQAVNLYGEDDSQTLVDPADYFAALADEPPRLLLRDSSAWCAPGRIAHGIGIDLTTGYGPAPADVPEPLRMAVLRFVAAWYEYREVPPPGTPASRLPNGVLDLLEHYRRVKL